MEGLVGHPRFLGERHHGPDAQPVRERPARHQRRGVLERLAHGLEHPGDDFGAGEVGEDHIAAPDFFQRGTSDLAEGQRARLEKGWVMLWRNCPQPRPPGQRGDVGCGGRGRIGTQGAVSRRSERHGCPFPRAPSLNGAPVRSRFGVCHLGVLPYANVLETPNPERPNLKRFGLQAGRTPTQPCVQAAPGAPRRGGGWVPGQKASRR